MDKCRAKTEDEEEKWSNGHRTLERDELDQNMVIFYA